MLKFKSKLIIVVILIFGITAFTSCSKSEKENVRNNNSVFNQTQKNSFSLEEYKLQLIKLNITFWTNLSSNPIAEIKNVCDKRDVNGLIKLSNLTTKQLSDFMNKSINFSSHIIHDETKSSCGCKSDIKFDEIYSFVKKIKDAGGAEIFFQNFVQNSQQNFKSAGGDIAACLAQCTLFCLPWTWDPPMWTICMAGCTAACYYIPD